MTLTKKIIALVPLAAIFAPALAFAQGLNTSYLQNSGNSVIHLINGTIIPLLIALTVIGFIWVTVLYFFSGKDDKKHAEHKTQMIYGVVAIFVIVSVWGFVNILQNIFGVSNNNANVQLPTVPGTY